MKIVFVSFVDSTNFGDQLIVHNLFDSLFTKEDEVDIYSYNFKEVKYSDIGKKPISKGTKLQSSIIHEFVAKNRKSNIIDFFISKYTKSNIRKRFLTSTISEDIKKADLVVIGGGNAIFDLTKYSDSAYKVKLIIDYAKKLNKHVYVSSIGVGPFIRNKQIERTTQVLDKADFVTVRDRKSYTYLKSLGDKLFSSVDPVFNMHNKLENDISYTNYLEIGINIMDLKANKNSQNEIEDYFNEMVDLVTDLSKTHKIHLFASEIRDQGVVDNVYESLENVSNVTKHVIENISDLKKLYEGLSLVIGTRMHSLILALTFEIPIIGISWQPKVTEMFKLTDLSKYCIPFETFSESSNSISSLVHTTDFKLYKNSLSSKIQNIRRKFDVNLNIMQKIRNGK